MSMSRLERDYLRLSPECALLDGRLFSSGGEMNLPTNGDTFVSKITPSEDVFFTILDITYDNSFSLDLWEGATVSGGTPTIVTPSAMNRGNIRPFKHDVTVGWGAADTTGATQLLNLDLSLPNQAASGVEEPVGFLIMKEGVDYVFVATARANNTTMGYRTRYIQFNTA